MDDIETMTEDAEIKFQKANAFIYVRRFVDNVKMRTDKLADILNTDVSSIAALKSGMLSYFSFEQLIILKERVRVLSEENKVVKLVIKKREPKRK